MNRWGGYKAIKNKLSKLYRQACDEKFVTTVLTDYNAARTTNPAKRAELTAFLNGKQAEFDAYADDFHANMQTLLKTGFSSHGDDGVIISAISKCAYYMTDYQFPIFDTMAYRTLNKILIRLGQRGIYGTGDAGV